MYNHVAWNVERRRKRKVKLKEILGAKCAKCGKIDNLQFDHINPDDKSFNISESLTKNWELLLKEIKKCQLLCFTCHWKKTREYRKSKVRHGTSTMYHNYHCRCGICIKAYARLRALQPCRQKGYIKPSLIIAANPQV